ncbi:ABC transporter ATP-binding protein [Myroides sp. 1354]|uniref:ABC transporter ATP-binding protein n=1 Tax=unclassified Myroides TaxID=2642485 RepID=UPI0025782BD1|nr:MULTISPECIES: ABC transporter ATP-binding protein [unclassified Myroides]MDM1043994.1 ABC transporter ATP-binding protein [Myroides sp. R163-1]MDM1054929.1 ABC transporter ATP-binding protein [Myroides sp. 1354]MDM1068226.1 ABC transporter ATP-binding protein [Myroides sp. 1372]
MSAQKPLLIVENLQVSFKQNKDWKAIVQGVSFELHTNQILGVVGESGSGKSVSSLALMRLLPQDKSQIKGKICFEGTDLTSYTEKEYRQIRGNKIAMIFQEPMSALNPSMRCGTQVEEMLVLHTTLKGKALKNRVIELFEQVKLPSPEEAYHKYPHELSGGQKQRVVIAMAIACKPTLLIADEPTTALDVTVQKEIIQLLKALQAETQMAMIFISHDLGLVSSIADEVMVMYRGQVVEKGPASAVFNQPQERYTQALLAARPSGQVRLERLPTIQDFVENQVPSEIITQEVRQAQHAKLYTQTPLLVVKEVAKDYISTVGLWGKKTFRALDQINFEVYEGETLGLVGESGCGKSTLGNAILQLDPATSGAIFYQGTDITKLKGKALRALRKDIQIIFQDPFSSLNPKLTVGQAIMEPMIVHGLFGNKKEKKQKVLELLQQVGLTEDAFDRYPHEFSGGQRQRIGIARTIAVHPKLIICDESVSALDISVQAQVLNLLNELKEQYQFTYIFISHDLAVVKYMSDQVMVMNKGKIEEKGEADALYANPKTAYTKKLIASILE